MATAKVSKAPKENVAQRLKRYKQEKKAAKIEENKKTMSKSTATSRRAALSTLKSNAASATTLSALKEKLDAAKRDEVEHLKKVARERGEESDTRKVTAAASRSLSRTKTSSQIPPKAKYSLSNDTKTNFCDVHHINGLNKSNRGSSSNSSGDGSSDNRENSAHAKEAIEEYEQKRTERLRALIEILERSDHALCDSGQNSEENNMANVYPLVHLIDELRQPQLRSSLGDFASYWIVLSKLLDRSNSNCNDSKNILNEGQDHLQALAASSSPLDSRAKSDILLELDALQAHAQALKKRNVVEMPPPPPRIPSQGTKDTNVSSGLLFSTNTRHPKQPPRAHTPRPAKRAHSSREDSEGSAASAQKDQSEGENSRSNAASMYESSDGCSTETSSSGKRRRRAVQFELASSPFAASDKQAAIPSGEATTPSRKSLRLSIKRDGTPRYG